MITWILITISVMMLLLYVLMNDIPSLRAVKIARKIDGFPGLPVVGSLYLLLTMKSDAITEFIEDAFAKYPRLARFEVSGMIGVIMKEAEDIQCILSSSTNIQKGYEYVPLEPWLKEGLLTSYGNKWHMRRKLLTPTFHFKILKDSLEHINRNAQLLSELLIGTDSRPVSVSDYITKCALDIIGDSAMGIKIKAQTGIGTDYLEAVEKTCSSMVERILTAWQYKLWMFRLTFNGRTFFSNLKILHDFSKKILKERKLRHIAQENITNEKDEGDSSDQGRVRRVFLDALLEFQRSNPGLLTDDDICQEVDTFMFEGHDTISKAITFTLLLLGHHPKEQEKVKEELDGIYEDSLRTVTMADTHKMLYMEKFIKETLRLYPSVPYMSRLLTQDCVLNDGVVIPKTTNVIVPSYVVHRNERFFPDPERFDPERFSEEEYRKRHPYAYIPFSAGPRNCIGQKFAMLEMKVILANILRRVKVESITKREDFKIFAHFIIRPTKPIICKFLPRNNNNYISEL